MKAYDSYEISFRSDPNKPESKLIALIFYQRPYLYRTLVKCLKAYSMDFAYKVDHSRPPPCMAFITYSPEGNACTSIC